MNGTAMGARSRRGPGARLRVHLVIQIVLLLLYFLPGGLLWNRVEPLLFGLPFSVAFTAVVMPALFVANMIFYVIGHWAEDRLVTSEVRRAAAAPPPPEPGSAPGATGGKEA